MKMKAGYSCVWMFILLSLHSLGEGSLSISPSRPLYLKEHGKLKLNCVHVGNNGRAKWMKDGIPLSDDEHVLHTFRTAKVVQGQMKVVTNITMTRDNVQLRDSGRYSCDSGDHSKGVTVKVLRVLTGSHVITDPGGIISLQCDPATSDVDVIWTKNLTSLAQLKDLSERIALESRNTTLKIKNASLADSGQYECHLKPRDGVVQGNLSTEVVLRGSPYFPDGHNVTETITISKERLELRCPALGYPVPKVIWKSEGSRVNSSGGIQLLSYRGVSCAVLRIEEYIPEFGESFVCEAFNTQGRTMRNFQVVFVNSAQSLPHSYAILILTSVVTLSTNIQRFIR